MKRKTLPYSIIFFIVCLNSANAIVKWPSSTGTTIDKSEVTTTTGNQDSNKATASQSIEEKAMVEKLNSRELLNVPTKDLRIIRNTIFAKHGREFKDPILKQYFHGKGWYKLNPNYSDALLTPTQKYNVGLLQSLEEYDGRYKHFDAEKTKGIIPVDNPEARSKGSIVVNFDDVETYECVNDNYSELGLRFSRERGCVFGWNEEGKTFIGTFAKWADKINGTSFMNIEFSDDVVELTALVGHGFQGYMAVEWSIEVFDIKNKKLGSVHILTRDNGMNNFVGLSSVTPFRRAKIFNDSNFSIAVALRQLSFKKKEMTTNRSTPTASRRVNSSLSLTKNHENLTSKK